MGFNRKKNAAMGRHHESSCMGDFSGHTRATRILRHAMYRINTHKGSLVGVEGRIQTRSYDDKDGKRVYVTEVVADSVQFLESKSAAASNANSNAYVPDYEQRSNQGYQEPYETSSTLDIASDDLPF